jgi:hypothetical protein
MMPERVPVEVEQQISVLSERNNTRVAANKDAVMTAEEFDARKRELFKGSSSSVSSSRSQIQFISKSTCNVADGQTTGTHITDMETQVSGSDSDDAPPLIEADKAATDDVTIQDSDIQCIVDMMGGRVSREDARVALENNFGENFVIN